MRKLLWLLPLVMFFIGCQKETSFEAPLTTNGASSGTSVYTLGGAGSSCTGAVVSGTYTKGVALNTTNTVTINVTVTTVGTYSISTASINGMTFAGTGTFISTGPKTITLTGSGTPTTVATSSISITAGPSTCTFSIPVVPAGPPATYTIAGAGSNCTGSTVSGTFTAGTALTSSNTVTIQVNVTVVGSYSITTTTNNGYSFSGAGTFTTLGTQSVIFTGNGTPIAAATDVFTAGASGCTFSVTVAKAAVTATDFITCKMNGTAMTFNFNPGAVISTQGTSSSTSISGNVSSGSSESILVATASVMGYNSSTINYLDASGSAWIGITGLSTISISITTQTATRITGTFSGTIKDNNGQGTNSKTVTEGKFDVPIL